MRPINGFIFWGITSILSLNFLMSASLYDPKLKWQTIETPHFSIHYHQGENDIAQLTANLAEEIHSNLSTFLPWKLKGKTQIILVDNTDIANGYATAFPYNTIGIYLTAPSGESLIGNYDHWLKMVLTHEYTHILHLDMVSGLPKLGRSIFGRIPLCFPNFFQPLWMIEGLAVLSETDFTTQGRGRAVDWEMLIKTACLEDKFLSQDRATGPLVAWPGGNSYYLYGNKFLKYLKDKYGIEKIIEVNQRNRGIIIPYIMTDFIFKKVYGKGTKTLWKEWQQEITKNYKDEKKLISQQGISLSKQLTNRGFYINGPRFSPDGKKIAYSEINAHGFPKIKIYDLTTKKDKSATERYLGNYLDWTKNGQGLIFSQIEYYKNFYLLSDLYLYQLKEKKIKRLTKGLRAKDPDISPQNDKIVMVINNLGKNNLAISNIEGSDIKFLTKNKNFIQYSSPRWSPDGERIAVSVGREGGYWDIYIFSERGEVITKITDDRARDLSPCWSPDGNYIVFSSDRSGIFNLYAYFFADKKIYQITNVLTGTFQPDISPEGDKIAFVSYSSQGYDLHLINFSPEHWKTASPYQDSYPKYQPITLKKKYTPHKYNPFSTLLPRFWMPFYRDGDLEIQPGIITFGYDVLEKHLYSLEAYYGLDSGKYSYFLNYIYDGLYPTFSLGLSDQTNFSQDSLTSEKYTDRKKEFSFRISFPFRKVKSRNSLFVEYHQEQRKIPYYKYDLNLKGIRLGWYNTNTKKYGYSISRTDGRRISLLFERDFKELGSDYDISKLIGEWREYIALPIKHHVLGLRLAGGTSWGKEAKKVFYMGGYQGSLGFLGIDSDFFNLLRGYKRDVFWGTNAVLLNIEYRMPLLNIERGLGNFPIFIQRMHLGLFADIGNTWWEDEKVNLSDFKTGIGAEIRIDITLGYILPLTLSLGGAKGLDKEFGQEQIYFRIGTSF